MAKGRPGDMHPCRCTAPVVRVDLRGSRPVMRDGDRSPCPCYCRTPDPSGLCFLCRSGLHSVGIVKPTPWAVPRPEPRYGPSITHREPRYGVWEPAGGWHDD